MRSLQAFGMWCGPQQNVRQNLSLTRLSNTQAQSSTVIVRDKSDERALSDTRLPLAVQKNLLMFELAMSCIACAMKMILSRFSLWNFISLALTHNTVENFVCFVSWAQITCLTANTYALYHHPRASRMLEQKDLIFALDIYGIYVCSFSILLHCTGAQRKR